MKKFLSLMMVVAMLFAVLAFVGCDNTDTETTTTASTSASTTESTSASTTESTSASTTESTSASTTESTTESTSETTTESTTTLPPVFARFDFGTDTVGEAMGLTSHEYLVENLTFDSNFISVDYTADTIIISALQDHPEITTYIPEGKTSIAEDYNKGGTEAVYSRNSYAILFEDLDLYSFDQHLTKADKFMKIRILNNTNNNMISFSFGDVARSGSAHSTNMMATCMYLQGGAPSVRDIVAGEHRLTAEPTTEWKSYTYDINLLMALSRFGQRGEAPADYSYADYTCRIGQGVTGTGSNNWNWIAADSEVHSLRFYLLGSTCPVISNTSYFAYSDTRANIKAGNTVEVDYILFAPTTGDFKNFVSNIESESLSVSASIAESISISESIAAAATASAAA